MQQPARIRRGTQRLHAILRAVAAGGALGLALLASQPTLRAQGAPADAATRGIRANAPWLSFYGTARQMGNLDRVAATFRLINIDADPDSGNFTAAQIRTLRAGGRNTVVSYLNVGSCERSRRYWTDAPSGLLPCGRNRRAQIAAYRGYPDEVWMNPAEPEYQRLLIEHVAPRLAAAGVDGFFLDNLEIVEHGPRGADTGAPCDRACVEGTLALVARLRRAFPRLVIIMQNATSATTLNAVVGGVPFPRLLDGISHEEVYAPKYDRAAEAELLAWRNLGGAADGKSFSITTLDYVGSCRDENRARRAYARSRTQGFSPYVTISSADQSSVCFWRL